MNIRLSKCILVLVLINLIAFHSKAQDLFKPKFYLDIKVLLYKTTDLKDLKAIAKLQQDGTVDELSFYDWIYYLKDGAKESYQESQIDHLEFIDFDGKKRVFVSSRYTDIKNARGLWEILSAGKITWYREYFPVVISGSRVCKTRDFFVKTGEEPVFANRPKKKLLALTNDRPDLTSRIKSLKKDADVMEILKIYNQ